MIDCMRAILRHLTGIVTMTLLAVQPLIAADSELKIRQLAAGSGAEATAQSKVSVHYSGWLEDGTLFDSSHKRGQPIEFTLGRGQVIPGWEQGVTGMLVGEKRELIIPPSLAYGKRGAGKVIPPDATLRFEVELVGVSQPPYRNIDNAELAGLLDAGTTIIDIRRPEEWRQTGVVAGSHLLTAFDGRGRLINSFSDELAKLVGKEEPFILICRTGNRTAALATALSEKLGYSDVINVTDGITRWIRDGKPVNKQCASFDNGKQCS